MKSEERINRLERLMKLFVRAGMRARSEMNEKINMLIDSQIKTDDRFLKFEERCARYDALFAKHDERFAKHDERFAKHDERFAKNDERFAKNDERFARFDERFKKFEERTDRTLDILSEMVKQLGNGRSKNPSQT